MQSPSNLNSVMSRLHARQLRLLIAVAEHGSLLAAGDRVGLTQPGASKALKELEATLNASLFMRTNRGLVPTEAGTCAVRFARLIQSDISHLQQELSTIASGAGGRIAVGTIMGAVPLLTRALARLMDQQLRTPAKACSRSSTRGGWTQPFAARRSAPSPICTTPSRSKTNL